MGLLKVLTISLLLVAVAFCQTGGSVGTENFIIIVDTLSLFILLGATLFAWELYKMMRGGQLAKSWGYITVGILAFSLGKLAEVGANAQLWIIPVWFSNVVTLVVAIMLILGVFSQRKTLS